VYPPASETPGAAKALIIVCALWFSGAGLVLAARGRQVAAAMRQRIVGTPLTPPGFPPAWFIRAFGVLFTVVGAGLIVFAVSVFF